ncbi:hypothetical protein DNTS_028987 [Danionella cerebrum]|uniref:Uncharacterized protein n=1 Tax=Danionella cerebrum TaxID=2873325 RepID=A0A553RH29_9TELE|nr:hypothetical protein DNTS_028987 [Danionella translucida]
MTQAQKQTAHRKIPRQRCSTPTTRPRKLIRAQLGREKLLHLTRTEVKSSRETYEMCDVGDTQQIADTPKLRLEIV